MKKVTDLMFRRNGVARRGGHCTVRLSLVVAGLCLALASTHAADTYYVCTNGLDSAAGTNWVTALATISNAMAKVVDGDTVMVSNGTYLVTTNVVVDKGVTLSSVNGQDSTIIDAQGGYGVRCMSIDHADAVVHGFTLRGGKLAWNAGRKGGGILMTAGTVEWCRLEDNEASNGGGGAIWMSGGLVQYCRIVNNNYGIYSGTVYMTGGTLRNCLVANNVYDRSAGVYTEYIEGSEIRIENCTIGGNAAGTSTGGISPAWGVKVVNTIVYFNTDPDGIAENFTDNTSAPFSYSCSTPLPTYGTDNITGDPQFTDMANGDYHLEPGSSCTNAGTTNLSWLATGFDLDGNPRVVDGKVDIGCFQTVVGALAGSFSADSTTLGLAPLQVIFTSEVSGTDLTGVDYQWDFENDGSIDAAGPVVTNVYTAGVFSVSMTVTNAAGESDTYTRTDYVTVGPRTNYVSATGSATFPYDTLGTAANDVQTALDVGVDGTLVLVAAGSYTSSVAISVENGITLRSLSGRDVTDLVVSTDWKRTVSIEHADAVVDGFTLRRVASTGGGVTIYAAGGTLQNCEVVGAKYPGAGGVYLYAGAGLVDRCVIRGCTSYNTAGWDKVGGVRVLAGCTLRNSLIIGNGGVKGETGGVLNQGTVENCTIVSNTVDVAVAAACGGLNNYTATAVTRNCIIVDNINVQGGTYTNWYRVDGTIEYSCTLPDASAWGSGNVTGNPLFTDMVDDDYSLQAGSPCMDAGTNQIWMTGAVDLGGNPRVAGSAVDMGGYEYVLPAGTVISIR